MFEAAEGCWAGTYRLPTHLEMSVLKLLLMGLSVDFFIFLHFVYNFLGLATFLQCHPLSENAVSLLVEITDSKLDMKQLYLLKRQLLLSEVPACRISENGTVL